MKRGDLFRVRRPGGEDALVSLPKQMLTDYVASLKPACLRAVDQALRVALALG